MKQLHDLWLKTHPPRKAATPSARVASRARFVQLSAGI
jgi:hypothetical protein